MAFRTSDFPANICLFKVNNRNTRKRCVFNVSAVDFKQVNTRWEVSQLDRKWLHSSFFAHEREFEQASLFLYIEWSNQEWTLNLLKGYFPQIMFGSLLSTLSYMDWICENFAVFSYSWKKFMYLPSWHLLIQSL